MSNNPEFSNNHASQARSGNDVSSPLKLHVLAGVALIATVIILAYYPCLRGGFMLDDNLLLTENQLMKASDGPYRFWFSSDALEYYPVTNTIFWIEWRVWGMDPTGYHAVNLIIHIADTLLLWCILRKLSIPGAFLAAMIFAVHPVNVESVAWIAQLRNVLTLFFSLLSTWCYLKADRYRAIMCMAPTYSLGKSREGETEIPWPIAPRHLRFFYWLSLSLFILALLSKGSSAVLPALLLGLIWWVRGVQKWDIVRITPFFAAAALFTWVHIWCQTHGSGEVFRTASIAERLLGAGCVVWFYLYKAILPYDLAFVYPQWYIQVSNPLWWLPLIGVFAVTAVLWRYRKGWSRPFLFAWGFFCVALVPVMGFTHVGFMQYSMVADHYQHIAIIGVIALAAAGHSTWRLNARTKTIWAASTITVMTVGTLLFLACQQCGLYGDVIRLYQVTLEKNPECWMIHNNLGYILFREGRQTEAVECFQQALYLKPDYDVALNNLGKCFIDEGRLPEAMEHFYKAIKSNPRAPEAYNNLGIVLAMTSRQQEAVSNFMQALGKDPYYAEAHYNLGFTLNRMGRVQEAINHYEQALRIKPDYFSAHNDLGLLLIVTGLPQEAIGHFKQALQLAPKEAETYKNMGIAMAVTGRLQEAIRFLERALALKPDFPDAHYQLGLALAEQGRKQEAIEHFEQVIRLNPEYFEADNRLGITLSEMGRVQEAIEHFKQVINKKPDHIDACTNLMLAYAKMGQSGEAVATAQKALEIARSNGMNEQAKKIEDWLNSYKPSLRE
jgi:protein O-mannosyl-transferase